MGIPINQSLSDVVLHFNQVQLAFDSVCVWNRGDRAGVTWLKVKTAISDIFKLILRYNRLLNDTIVDLHAQNRKV